MPTEIALVNPDEAPRAPGGVDALPAFDNRRPSVDRIPFMFPQGKQNKRLNY